MARSSSRVTHVGPRDGPERQWEADVALDGGGQFGQPRRIGGERVVPEGEIQGAALRVPGVDFVRHASRGPAPEGAAGHVVGAEGAARRASAAGEDPAGRGRSGRRIVPGSDRTTTAPGKEAPGRRAGRQTRQAARTRRLRPADETPLPESDPHRRGLPASPRPAGESARLRRRGRRRIRVRSVSSGRTVVCAPPATSNHGPPRNRCANR